MMTLSNKQQVHRFAALILLLLLLIIAWVLVAELFNLKLASEAEHNHARVMQQEQLNKQQTLDDLKKRHQQLNQQPDKRYISSNDLSLSLAEFQRKIRSLTGQLQIAVTSIQTTKSEPTDGLISFNVTLELELTHQQMIRLLFLLEHNTPSGFVQHLQINQNAYRQTNQPSRSNILKIRLTYTTFIFNLPK